MSDNKPLIPVTYAIINKAAIGFPLIIDEAQVDAKVLWDYMMHDDAELSDMAKAALNIDVDAEVFFGVYAEYLIDPTTGKICRSDGGPSREEFLSHVRNRQSALLAEYGYSIGVVS